MLGNFSLFYLFAAIAALGGFCIATYIRHKKAILEPLVCPIGHSCDPVIHSDFSRFFGIPIEGLGMLYYAIITFAYVSLLFRPELLIPPLALFLLLLSTVAFLFSLYLTFIQAFALKQWCTWCLISAGLCTLIFSFTLLGSEYAFVTLLADHRRWFVAAHLLGIVFGLGGATISDVMFIKFLKDLRISATESGVLRTLSQVIWFGLAILVLSGLALYVPDMARLNGSVKFISKMIVVAVIIINGAFLNLYIAPKLVEITFGKWVETTGRYLRRARKWAFAMGAVSLVSWYSAFVLGVLRGVNFSLKSYLGVYLAAIVIGICVSQVTERLMGRRSVPASPSQGGPLVDSESSQR